MSKSASASEQSARPIVLAMTGASGAGTALRLLETLLRAGRAVHLTASPAFAQVLKQELDRTVDLDRFEPAEWLRSVVERYGSPEQVARAAAQSRLDPALVRYSRYDDLFSPLASGSALTAGMVVCPCSGGTLGAIAHAQGTNLIHRAAEVHLKERRKLILVPRETPLSLPQIENLRSVTLAGAIVLPASPGWYHDPRSPLDLIDFLVARICDQLDVEHDLMTRWGD
ncbi:MAG: flavin prenyltransferase UbiX [Pirellulales bacterium]